MAKHPKDDTSQFPFFDVIHLRFHSLHAVIYSRSSKREGGGGGEEEGRRRGEGGGEREEGSGRGEGEGEGI